MAVLTKQLRKFLMMSNLSFSCFTLNWERENRCLLITYLTKKLRSLKSCCLPFCHLPGLPLFRLNASICHHSHLHSSYYDLGVIVVSP